MTKNFRIRNYFRISDFVVSIALIGASIYFINSIVSDTSATSTDQLIIDGISLNTPVKKVELTGTELVSPETIAGAYEAADNKTLLIGHSTTVFKKLDQINGNMTIKYRGKDYQITEMVLMKKEDISMFDLTRPAKKDTIVLMTCAGEATGNHDFTHRLIVTAIAK